MDSQCHLPDVPSVIHDERDRTFLADLNEFIGCELCHVDCHDAHQYYTVYKQVFSRVSASQLSIMCRICSRLCDSAGIAFKHTRTCTHTHI